MHISRANYEIFFVDYFDGTLPGPSKQVLFAFLKKHPDLQAEFEAYSNTPLPAEPVSYPDKEDLKKPSLHPVASIDTRNYEDYLIAKSEGDLGKQEKAHLEQFLKKNPEVAKEAFVYAKLKLAANKSITYHNKESLKKRPLLVHLQRKAVVYGVAASVLLLIGMLWLIPRTAGKTHPVNTVATYAATTIYHENHPMQPALRHAAKPAFTPEVTPIREKQQPVNVMAGLRSPEQFHVSYTAGNMYKRLDHTSNYFYHQIREDLEYYVALQEYSKKSVLGKVVYQAENRIAAKEMYITDPAISDFDFSPASLATLNELSFSDLVPSGEVAKSEPKNRSFKSSFFEYSHTKGK